MRVWHPPAAMRLHACQPARPSIPASQATPAQPPALQLTALLVRPPLAAYPVTRAHRPSPTPAATAATLSRRARTLGRTDAQRCPKRWLRRTRPCSCCTALGRRPTATGKRRACADWGGTACVRTCVCVCACASAAYSFFLRDSCREAAQPGLPARRWYAGCYALIRTHTALPCARARARRTNLGLLGAEGFDAIAPDWIGHGDSDMPVGVQASPNRWPVVLSCDKQLTASHVPYTRTHTSSSSIRYRSHR
jgi:hypothetical protein